jgi:tetrapyrrole methylase family protein / MazG family protein
MTARPRVVVVGLGPADVELVTAASLAAIERVPHRYLRTARHPAARAVPDATTFDDVYETAGDFDEVYRTIVERLVAAATDHGEVLYAVPGSPLVLERSVRLLRADPRVDVTVLAALSFLDLAYDRLGIDPVEARLTLVDAHTFAASAAGHAGPLLVAHAHNRRVLSDVKLAVDDEPGEPATVLQRLGLPDEAVFTVPWAELDRSFEPDHLTALYVPSLAAPVGAELVRFHEVVGRLRRECPWDREQTHDSLARYAIEETYELVEAIARLGPDGVGDDELAGELGDVLLQVVLHAAIAEQQGRFTLADVASGITEKMVRRHPHVFGSVEVDGAEHVVANWEAIKRAERAERGDPSQPESSVDGVNGHLPALAYAREMSSRASKAGFDWDDPWGTIDKVREEIDEIVAAWDDPVHVAEEIGDLLFATTNLARHRKVDPEVALRNASAKFRRRIQACEALAAERGIDTRTAGLAALDALWDEVKRTGA